MIQSSSICLLAFNDDDRSNIFDTIVHVCFARHIMYPRTAIPLAQAPMPILNNIRSFFNKPSSGASTPNPTYPPLVTQHTNQELAPRKKLRPRDDLARGEYNLHAQDNEVSWAQTQAVDRLRHEYEEEYMPDPEALISNTGSLEILEPRTSIAEQTIAEPGEGNDMTPVVQEESSTHIAPPEIDQENGRRGALSRQAKCETTIEQLSDRTKSLETRIQWLIDELEEANALYQAVEQQETDKR